VSESDCEEDGGAGGILDLVRVVPVDPSTSDGSQAWLWEVLTILLREAT
jgi:hypothetical protein